MVHPDLHRNDTVDSMYGTCNTRKLRIGIGCGCSMNHFDTNGIDLSAAMNSCTVYSSSGAKVSYNCLTRRNTGCSQFAPTDGQTMYHTIQNPRGAHLTGSFTDEVPYLTGPERTDPTRYLSTTCTSWVSEPTRCISNTQVHGHLTALCTKTLHLVGPTSKSPMRCRVDMHLVGSVGYLGDKHVDVRC